MCGCFPLSSSRGEGWEVTCGFEPPRPKNHNYEKTATPVWSAPSGATSAGVNQGWPPEVACGWRRELVAFMLRGEERRAGSRHCPLLGQGETLYGTRTVPGWYQGSAGARGTSRLAHYSESLYMSIPRRPAGSAFARPWRSAGFKSGLPCAQVATYAPNHPPALCRSGNQRSSRVPRTRECARSHHDKRIVSRFISQIPAVVADL